MVCPTNVDDSGLPIILFTYMVWTGVGMTTYQPYSPETNCNKATTLRLYRRRLRLRHDTSQMYHNTTHQQ